MQEQDIDIEALKKNEEFLANLVLLEEEMKEEKSIQKAYQLLDALLLVSDDEDKINEVFTFILGEAFDRLAEYLSQQKGFDLTKEEELFQVLHYMVDEERLKDAMMVHAVSVMKGKDFDTFISDIADTSKYDVTDRLAYFLLNFKIDSERYLRENKALVNKAQDELKVLEGD